MQFEKQTLINATPERVFRFHETPGALEKITPPWEKARLVEGGTSLAVGSRVILEVKMGPFPLRWVAEHTEYDSPHKFADRQVSGPFASWYHTHSFEPDGSGGTFLKDSVEYTLPLGWLGALMGGGFVRRKLMRMFNYRHEVTKKLIEGEA